MVVSINLRLHCPINIILAINEEIEKKIEIKRRNCERAIVAFVENKSRCGNEKYNRKSKKCTGLGGSCEVLQGKKLPARSDSSSGGDDDEKCSYDNRTCSTSGMGRTLLTVPSRSSIDDGGAEKNDIFLSSSGFASSSTNDNEFMGYSRKQATSARKKRKVGSDVDKFSKGFERAQKVKHYGHHSGDDNGWGDDVNGIDQDVTIDEDSIDDVFEDGNDGKSNELMRIENESIGVKSNQNIEDGNRFDDAWNENADGNNQGVGDPFEHDDDYIDNALENKNDANRSHITAMDKVSATFRNESTDVQENKNDMIGKHLNAAKSGFLKNYASGKSDEIDEICAETISGDDNNASNNHCTDSNNAGESIQNECTRTCGRNGEKIDDLIPDVGFDNDAGMINEDNEDYFADELEEENDEVNNRAVSSDERGLVAKSNSIECDGNCFGDALENGYDEGNNFIRFIDACALSDNETGGVIHVGGDDSISPDDESSDDEVEVDVDVDDPANEIKQYHESRLKQDKLSMTVQGFRTEATASGCNRESGNEESRSNYGRAVKEFTPYDPLEVEYDGDVFEKYQCYLLKERTKIIVGIRRFVTQDTAECILVEKFDNTLLGIQDDGIPYDADYMMGNHVQVYQCIETLPLSKLGTKAAHVDKLPRMIYQPQTPGNWYTFGYFYDRNDLQKCSNRQGSIRSLEVFAGAGGSLLGYKKYGFETVMAIENDQNAAQTLRANNPELKVYDGCIMNFLDSYDILEVAVGRIDHVSQF